MLFLSWVSVTNDDQDKTVIELRAREDYKFGYGCERMQVDS